MADVGYACQLSATKDDLLALMVEKLPGTTEQKWQLSSLAMYGDPDDPRFAFVAHAPALRPWSLELDVSGELDFIGRSVAKAGHGSYPTIVTGTGAEDVGRWDYYRLTVVYERFPQGMAPSTLFNVTEGWAETALSKDWFVASIDSFGTRLPDGQGSLGYLERVAVLSYAQVPGAFVPFSVQRVDDHGWAQVVNGAQNQAVLENWARMDHAVPSRWTHSGSNSALVTYRKDVYEPWPDELFAWTAPGAHLSGPSSLSLMEEQILTRQSYGYWPHRIGANGSASAPRFCCSFVPYGKRKPKIQYFVVTDATDPSPPTHVPKPTLKKQAFTSWLKGKKVAIGSQPAAEASPGIDGVDQETPGPFDQVPLDAWTPSPLPGAPWVRARLLQRPASAGDATSASLPSSVDAVFEADAALHLLSGSAAPGSGPTGAGLLFDPSFKPPPAPSPAQWLAQIDTRSRLEMEFRASRHAQLVITVDGKAKLGRAYTLGELNYLCTRMDHKFAVASVAKWLSSIAAVAYFTDPQSSVEEMTEALRGVTLPAAFGVDVSFEIGDGKFAETTLRDLMSHHTAWSGYDFPAKTKALLGKNRLEPGDMARYFQEGPKDFYGAGQPGAPASKAYNNFAFIALAEAVSGRATPTKVFDRFLEATRLLWGLTEIESHWAPFPSTRKLNLENKVVPLHSFWPGWADVWQTNDVLERVSNAYGNGSDAEWWMGTDGCMTMGRLPRTLDGIVEGTSPGVKPLLSENQRTLMANMWTPLGMDSAQLYQPPGSGAVYLRMFKNGGVNGGVAFAAVYFRLSGTGPQSVTVAFATEGAHAGFGPTSADALMPAVLALMASGHWGEDQDLYALLP